MGKRQGTGPAMNQTSESVNAIFDCTVPDLEGVPELEDVNHNLDSVDPSRYNHTLDSLNCRGCYVMMLRV